MPIHRRRVPISSKVLRALLLFLRFETSIANQSLSNSLCEELVRRSQNPNPFRLIQGFADARKGFAKPFYELGQASRPESRKHFQFLLSASRLIHSLYSAKPMGSSARQILFGGGSRFVLNHWMCDRLLLTYCSRGCENSCLTLSKLFTCNLGTNSHTPRGWLCDPLLIHSWCFGRLLGSCWVVVCS